ncbi:hypothetical protein GCM10010372_04950 [Streptomyces tauricus]|nr:hypothetical protein GCM10010372_04950 [Streptomyces tauricus]
MAAWEDTLRKRRALLRVRDDAIVLHAMRRPDEIASDPSAAGAAVLPTARPGPWSRAPAQVLLSVAGHLWVVSELSRVPLLASPRLIR